MTQGDGKICGLVGVITKTRNGYNMKQLDVFETLLWLDTLRGEDSTGVFAVNNIGNVGIAKEIGTGANFLSSKEWNQTMRSNMYKDGWALFGHNRKATRGTVTDENAHPFWVEDKVVLIHNGSFNGCHKKLADTAVDSHAIAHVLAEHGGDDIEGALKKVNAAYALIWYDVDKKRVNMIRNSQRPLHWVETADAWYFASEEEMLVFALGRHNVTIVSKEVHSFPEHSLNSWTLQDNKSSEVTSEDLDCKYSGPPAVSSYTPSFGRSQDYYNSMYGVEDACGWEPGGTVFDKSEEKTTVAKAEVVVLEPNAVMPWMKKVTLRDFGKLKEAYPSGNKISVIVDDYVDVDTTSSTVTVTGVTLDGNRVPAMFDISRELLDTCTNPHLVGSDDLTFSITVSNCTWRRTDKRNHKDIDDAEGVLIIKGTNPTISFKGNVGVMH